MQIAGVPSTHKLEDLYVEHRVLCAFLINTGDERAEMNDLEVDDFFNMHNVLAFTAMRNLQARAIPVAIENVIDWLDAQGKGDAFDLGAFMGRTLVMPDYPDVATLRRDLSWLRKLQLRRVNEVALDEKYAAKKGGRW